MILILVWEGGLPCLRDWRGPSHSLWTGQMRGDDGEEVKWMKWEWRLELWLVSLGVQLGHGWCS